MYRRMHRNLLVCGAILMILSPLPGKIFQLINPDFQFTENLTLAFLLIFLSIGLFFIVMTALRLYTYAFLADMNKRNPRHRKESAGDMERGYSNQIIEKGMSVFWPTILCFYLSMSFITFAWGISWIIWPMGWMIYEIVGHIFKERE